MMHDGTGLFFGGGFMWLFWIVLAVLVVMLVRGISSNSKPEDLHANPLDILKERYARGEINEEEFERRRKELES